MNKQDPVDGYEEHLGSVVRGAKEARLAGEVSKKESPKKSQEVDGLSPRSKL